MESSSPLSVSLKRERSEARKQQYALSHKLKKDRTEKYSKEVPCYAKQPINRNLLPAFEACLNQKDSQDYWL